MLMHKVNKTRVLFFNLKQYFKAQAYIFSLL